MKENFPVGLKSMHFENGKSIWHKSDHYLAVRHTWNGTRETKQCASYAEAYHFIMEME
jgi:hypothetical protein